MSGCNLYNYYETLQQDNRHEKSTINLLKTRGTQFEETAWTVSKKRNCVIEVSVSKPGDTMNELKKALRQWTEDKFFFFEKASSF